MSQGPRGIYPALFFTSLAALSFEVLLTRVFSITLWYHFAFMVVSIAMLGLASSGTVVAAMWALGKKKPSLRPAYFFFFGLTMIVAYLVAVRIPFDPVRISWDRLQLVYISLYYLVLSVPFFMAGLILVSAFISRGEESGMIYTSDLSGAAAGTLLVLAAQTWLAPGQAVCAASLLALVGAMITGGRRIRVLSASLAFLLAVAITADLPFIRVRMSPYKELPGFLRMAGAETLETLDSPFGRVDLFRSPGLRYAPGLSLKYRGDIPGQVGLALDGGSVTTLNDDPEAAGLEFLGYLPAALAFELRPHAKVLLVDPRGSVPLLLAERARARRVDCTESNPAVERLLRSRGVMKGCTGGLESGLGRNFVLSGGRHYDIIDLPLTGSMPTGHMGGGEDYGLTVEAFETYLNSLSPEGIMNISLYINPPHRSEMRIFPLVLAALDRLGVKDPSRHAAAIRSLGLLCLLVKRSPFGDGEIEKLREFARSLWFDPVFYHGMSPDEGDVHIRTTGESLTGAYGSLADPGRRDRFIASTLFDISPPVDDRPYFHDHLKLATLRQVYDLVEGKWDFFIQEGYLLPAIFVQVLAVGFLMVVAPVFLTGVKKVSSRASPLLYFAFLGLGYMWIEVGMIQRMILPLEHPTYAVAVVLGTLLVGSGLGSYAARRWSPPHVWKAAAAVALLSLGYLAGGDYVAFALVDFPLATRGVLVFFFLFPAGFLMGMPFPGGLRALARTGEDLIPWAWAVNGFFAVLAPILAIMCAMAVGFSGVLGLAAAAYLGAAFSGSGFCASPTIGTNRTPPI